MTLITEMMQRPLDPGYAAAAAARQESGLPAQTGRRSLLLVVVAVLIGALLGVSAMVLRAPTSTPSRIKLDLVGRIETGRAHSDAQTRLIDTLRSEINAAQAAALSQQSQGGLAAELSRLEQMAGTVPVTGPGLVLTIDDAVPKIDPANPDADPRTSTASDPGRVLAKDLQIIVNGLWEAGAEAIAVNGHRLTSRAAIRFAGEAILVDSRPLTRPYTITAIGDPGSLNVEFTDNSGGSHLHSLANYQIRSNVQDQESVVVPGDAALSVLNARPVESAVRPVTPSVTPLVTPQRITPTAPRTTETSP
jgi:uncharacterized protein YlxW (UPF0749 family)